MASKNSQQMEFLKDYALLLIFAHGYATAHNAYVTFGETYRPDEMQALYFERGLSQVKDKGSHGLRMAGDINMIRNGKIVDDSDFWEPLGQYWQSLSPLNVWGGNFSFNDYGHYERELA